MKNVKKLLALAVVAGLAVAGTAAPPAGPSSLSANVGYYLSEHYGMSFWDAMRLTQNANAARCPRYTSACQVFSAA